ncbi:hypothetical protein DFH09DRAFT_1079866 [Mycena vulgaris]|nr:hypothetical protein DFH09DRAFT_1079866 [Mycena vulgaris]
MRQCKTAARALIGRLGVHVLLHFNANLRSSPFGILVSFMVGNQVLLDDLHQFHLIDINTHRAHLGQTSNAAAISERLILCIAASSFGIGIFCLPRAVLIRPRLPPAQSLTCSGTAAPKLSETVTRHLGPVPSKFLGHFCVIFRCTGSSLEPNGGTSGDPPSAPPGMEGLSRAHTTTRYDAPICHHATVEFLLIIPNYTLLYLDTKWPHPWDEKNAATFCIRVFSIYAVIANRRAEAKFNSASSFVVENVQPAPIIRQVRSPLKQAPGRSRSLINQLGIGYFKSKHYQAGA